MNLPKRPVRIGIQVHPWHALYPAIRDTVRALDDLGVDVIFNSDHFFPIDGDPHGLQFEAWSMLGSWAEITERAELGSLVTCNGLRNPDLQADMARTIDHMSEGRFLFGTGAGWNERDHVEYGYPFGTVGSRLDQLALDLPRILARWDRLNPAPLRKIPVLVGGGGERKTMRIAAAYADIWHCNVGPDDLPHKLAVLEAHGRDAGRDVTEIEIGNDLFGRSELEVNQLHEIGVTLFTIGMAGPDYDLATVRRWLAWRDGVNGSGSS
jgi:probable F420-dependent oxidoreductase